ncbi:PREDICTED: cystatin-B [Condylura cristata]|uniref:cystatin-B n=1 Tax=Condylura cristata TaxID=143302 RepID=UPI000334554F|nr:PREDICTED: cystatin-B [Condylura cristata]
MHKEGTKGSRADDESCNVCAWADRASGPRRTEGRSTGRRLRRGPQPRAQPPPPQVKAQLEEKENKKFPTFKAVEFKSQLVAGRNYFIKVQVGEEEFVHLRVFQSLPHEDKPLSLSSYQTAKTRHDELSYF